MSERKSSTLQSAFSQSCAAAAAASQAAFSTAGSQVSFFGGSYWDRGNWAVRGKTGGWAGGAAW